MYSFLIFHHDKPIAVQCTALIAGGEKRYVVSMNENGVVIRENKEGWEVLGGKSIDSTILKQIGDKIKELANRKPHDY